MGFFFGLARPVVRKPSLNPKSETLNPKPSTNPTSSIVKSNSTGLSSRSSVKQSLDPKGPGNPKPSLNPKPQPLNPNTQCFSNPGLPMKNPGRTRNLETSPCPQSWGSRVSRGFLTIPFRKGPCTIGFRVHCIYLGLNTTI